MDTYIVYKHTCPNGKCYIGITKQKPSYRWGKGSGYNTQVFGRAVKKYGWDNIAHEVLYEGLSLEEAYSKEIELIAKYKSNDKKYGYNCNSGGEGGLGYRHSDEARAKMREHTLALWNDPVERQRMLLHLKSVSEHNRGRAKPKEAIEKLTEALSVPVLQYDKEFNLIREHCSLMEAARSFGKNSNTLICRACKQPSRTAYGYYWRYKDNPITEGEIKELSVKKPKYNAVPIRQYTKDGAFVAEYESIHDAGRINKISYKGIWNALSGVRPSAYGYMWKYADCEV